MHNKSRLIFHLLAIHALELAFFAGFAGANDRLSITQLLPFASQDSLRIKLRITTSDSSPIQVNAAITALPGGEPLWSGPLGSITPIQNHAELQKTIDHLTPKLWTITSPNLYSLQITTTQNHATTTKSVRFGFRTFVTRDAHFYLNGHPIFLRGVAINPPGRGIPDSVSESHRFAQDYVKYLRTQGVNIIRLQYDSQTWFNVCDEQGMLVYQGVYGSPPGTLREGKHDESLPTDFNASMASYRTIFEAYVPHPSIVINILSNEQPYEGDRGQQWHDFLSKASDWCKANIDNTRPYIGNAGYGEGHEGDINDVHRYWAWYYNTYLTFYNLRNPRLFGDYDKNQPFTFSECVGNFTGPLGEYNLTFVKQLSPRLGWIGATNDPRGDAQKYQGLVVQQVTESFRRLRDINPRICGLMPFTILFHNWNGISSFDQMIPTAALNQMSMSYSPVLLSWEMWTPNVYAGTSVRAIAHVVNDSDDFTDLHGAKIEWQLTDRSGRTVVSNTIAIPDVKYYGTWTSPISIDIPPSTPTSEYQLFGKITQNGNTIATNHTDLFIAGTDWKATPLDEIHRTLLIYDPSNHTAAALKKLNIPATPVTDFANLPPNSTLIIGELSCDKSTGLKSFIHNGGRVLCLAQDDKSFKPDWLPTPIEMFTTSSTDPQYPVKIRPTFDQMNINPERPDHPIFAGLDRHRFWTWSDYTHWDETKPGFPQICPVTHGFKLTNAADFAHTAILADYDRGLEGVALCEMFQGKGSVLLTGLDIIHRVGLDPVADRMLFNLISYASNNTDHPIHPLIDQPIIWGNLPTEHGVNTGPLTGLIYNCRWVPTEFTKTEKPMPDNTGHWNTLPGEQFITIGIRPFGPYTWTAAAAPVEADKTSPTGSGEFWCRLPIGRTKMISTIQNPSEKTCEIQVAISKVVDCRTNGSSDGKMQPLSDAVIPAHLDLLKLPPGAKFDLESPLPKDATDICVEYKGDKQLVILQTEFQ